MNTARNLKIHSRNRGIAESIPHLQPGWNPPSHNTLFFGLLCLLTTAPANAALDLSQYPLFTGSINRANVLLILDNSNSMDETPAGAAAPCSAVNQCGSASDFSKSQIARAAAKSLISNYANRINLGLMAYQQNGMSVYALHTSPYDASYDPANYDPTFTGARESTTKRFRIPNPSDPGNYIYFNVALPFYDSANQGNAFCYSPTANPFWDAPTDTYRCFWSKTGTSDAIPLWGDAASEAAAGYSNVFWQVPLGPTDSDLAQGIVDFGKRLTWSYVGPTWFVNSSPGGGYLHVPIAPLDATQAGKLNTKLDRSQFVTNAPTDPAYPLQNAGLTPIEGTFITAQNYYLGSLTSVSQGGSQAAPPSSCKKNFAVLLTDGLPSTDKNGGNLTNPASALAAAATAASNLHASTAGVETYIIGFALPYGTNPTTLDTIASAGGTSKAYSASDLTTLNATLGTIFSDILLKAGSAASVATNSSNLKTENRVFQAKFSSIDWSGQLLQYKLNDLTTAEWDAGSKINSQSADSRVIITKGATGGVAFRWANLTASQQTFLNQNASGTADGLGSSRVAYLRGDASNETSNSGIFRARTVSKLGDLVNSNPWYVGPPAAGYSDVDYPGYAAFRNGALSRKSVVYIGGNDGMVHGFDASLASGSPAGTAGNEVLAYVPSAVYTNLSKLTGQSYNQDHRYFVDGSPMAGDANLGSSWATVLIGSLAGGGKGYYALDITNPGSFSEGTAANTLLWEFTDSDDGDVGYAFNNPPANPSGQAKQIVKMANGKWAVILGNGYNSIAGKAVLYILFLGDGIDGTWNAGDFVKITADAPAGMDNGLSTPVPFDTDGDGYVDTVYAGDLKGHMWKFLVGPNTGDASVTTAPSTWKVAFSAANCTNNCTPLFTATDGAGTPQPITWPPEVTLHPDNGTMVLFGTGKYLESGDNASLGVQSFYGIHDAGATVSGRGDLLAHTISTTTVGSATDRTVSTGDCKNSSGWYADLPTSGERMTGTPKVDSGTIFFNTFWPSADPCAAADQHNGWLMAMDYQCGNQPANRIFDTNQDHVINNADTIVSGLQVGAALGGTTQIRSKTPGKNGIGVSSLITGELVTTALNLGLGARGRVTWREIIQ